MTSLLLSNNFNKEHWEGMCLTGARNLEGIKTLTNVNLMYMYKRVERRASACHFKYCNPLRRCSALMQ